jgi:hypothetical protein
LNEKVNQADGLKDRSKDEGLLYNSGWMRHILKVLFQAK